MGRKLVHGNLVGAYVYAIVVDDIVRYIGKGRRYRAIEHFRYARELNRLRADGQKVKARLFHNKLAKALRHNSKVTYEIIAKNLDDDSAYERERLEIFAVPKGQLWNLRDGGVGSNSDVICALWKNREFRAKTIAGARAAKVDPAYRALARQNAHEQWSDLDFRQRWLQQHRALWDDPVLAEERRVLLKKIWNDPEKSARKSALVKSQWTPERRAKQSAWAKAWHSDHEAVARAVAKSNATKAAKRAKRDDRPEAALHVFPAQSEKVQI